MKSSHLGVFSGALIVAGTSIGGGMLGLPVVTGPSGFLPSLLVLVSSWAFMTLTGLLFCELCLWKKEQVNILGLCRTTLGKNGTFLCWLLYLFLFYSLTIAYLVGGSNFINDFIGVDLSPPGRIAIFVAIFVPLVLLGKRVIDPVNQLFMMGLLLSYFGLVFIALPSISSDLLAHQNWMMIFKAFPIAFTAFAFQGTVPTLCSWMDYDGPKIRKALVVGTSITLVAYILWQAIFLGIVPKEGEHGLIATLREGRDAVHPLQYFTQNTAIWGFARAFGFFALTTSFLGVGIGLVDFLRDGLGIVKKNFKSQLVLAIAAYAVPVIVAVLCPWIFLNALGLAGGIGCALLLGVMPIAMVYYAKLKQKTSFLENSILGRTSFLLLLLTFAVFEIICEVISLI